MYETGVFIALIVVAVGLLVLGALSKKRKIRLGVDVYQRREQLFSAAELRFLTVLDKAIAPGQRVFGKVRVARISWL
jgi:hypothetical protein